ncbi:MAG: hypothetical protein LQ340_000187 [Diploschistes diacapsis]|nr:MAG: hypothetical protein LQ340_000187 [Diploschistes diacapsis]
MAAAGKDEQDRLALVSSLYGPGTIACWYLTTLSVLVAWTLHPHKRKSGSIDVDLITVLTLPAVAAGHLISQVRAFLSQDHTARQANHASPQSLQALAAIEAPLIVVETFMAISVVLFVIAAMVRCIRKAIVVALIGLFCLAVDCYVHFSGLRDFGLQYKPGSSNGDATATAFSRLFVAGFPGLITSILVTLSICAIITSFAIAVLMVVYHGTSSTCLEQDVELVNSTDPTGPSALRSGPPVSVGPPSLGTANIHGASKGETLCMRAVTSSTILFLPSTFLASLLPLHWHSIEAHTATSVKTASQTVVQYAARFTKDFFPHTAYSIADLDQAVATTAGGTVLAFGIYNVAKSRYMSWTCQNAANLGQTDASSSIDDSLSGS